MKLERLRQEGEIKRLKAETTAQIREAQLKGLASTVRAARQQIGGPESDTPKRTVEEVNQEVPALPESVSDDIEEEVDATPVQPTPTGQALTALVARIWQSQRDQDITPTVQTILEAIQQEGYMPPDKISIANSLVAIGDKKARATGTPRANTMQFRAVVLKTINKLESDLEQPTLAKVAARLGETEANVKPAYDMVMSARKQLTN
jgi:hypothetical protein